MCFTASLNDSLTGSKQDSLCTDQLTRRCEEPPSRILAYDFACACKHSSQDTPTAALRFEKILQQRHKDKVIANLIVILNTFKHGF